MIHVNRFVLNILFIFPLVFFSVLSFAFEEEKYQLQWFPLKWAKIQKKENNQIIDRFRLIFNSELPEGTVVELPQVISRSKWKDSGVPLKNALLSSSSTKVKKDSRFTFQLVLPPELYAMVLKFTLPNRSVIVHEIALLVSDETVKMYVREIERHKPPPKLLVSFDLQPGLSSTRLSQTRFSSGTELVSDTQDFYHHLSFSVEAYPFLGLYFHSRNSGGSIPHSSSISILDASFKLESTHFELAYYPKPFRFLYENQYRGYTSVRLGYLSESMPYFQRLSSQTLILDKTQLNYATLGLTMEINPAGDFWVQFLIYWNHLLKKKNEFNPTQKYAADLGVHFYYRLYSFLQLGFSASGHQRLTEFEIYDAYTERPSVGTHSVTLFDMGMTLKFEWSY